MLPYILLAIGLILIGIFSVLWKGGRSDRENMGSGLAISTICTIILLAIWMGFYADSVVRNGPIFVAAKNAGIVRETFLSANAGCVIRNPDGTIANWPNLMQSQATTQLLQDYCKFLVAYNEIIATRKVIRENWLISGFVAPLPVDTRLLDWDLQYLSGDRK